MMKKLSAIALATVAGMAVVLGSCALTSEEKVGATTAVVTAVTQQVSNDMSLQMNSSLASKIAKDVANRAIASRAPATALTDVSYSETLTSSLGGSVAVTGTYSMSVSIVDSTYIYSFDMNLTEKFNDYVFKYEDDEYTVNGTLSYKMNLPMTMNQTTTSGTDTETVTMSIVIDGSGSIDGALTFKTGLKTSDSVIALAITEKGTQTMVISMDMDTYEFTSTSSGSMTITITGTIDGESVNQSQTVTM